MNKLKMKAKAGVTLVELLVVILIVTILSVSMLPLLKPFVVEAQYAAEPIPVIGNLRTKVGLYQYDKGRLPCISTLAGAGQQTGQSGQTGGQQGQQASAQQTAATIETWMPVANATSSSAGNPETDDLYKPAYVTYGSATAITLSGLTIAPASSTEIKHIGYNCDIDYADLKGKRSKPQHYQYLVMYNGSAEYVYAVGCFGDGYGLPKGTGYAVCEINMNGHKYVGTWRRYKPVANADVQICFTSTDSSASPDGDLKKTAGCYMPQESQFQQASSGSSSSGTGGQGGANNATIDTLIAGMVARGWEF